MSNTDDDFHDDWPHLQTPRMTLGKVDQAGDCAQCEYLKANILAADKVVSILSKRITEMQRRLEAIASLLEREK